MSETANTQAETGKKGKMSARELTTLGQPLQQVLCLCQILSGRSPHFRYTVYGLSLPEFQCAP